MTTFATRVAGIPCRCHVTHYAEAQPMRVTGTGFGDAEPPEPEEFEFEILDKRGKAAPWLAAKLQEGDEDRLRAEFIEISRDRY